MSAGFETPEAYLERVLATWVGRLRLSHWDIKIDWTKTAGDDNHAEVDTEEDYDLAVIRVHLEGFREWSQRFANETIVHELVHVMQRDLNLAARAIEKRVHPAVFEMHADRWLHEWEGAVDRTATVLVELGGVVI